MPIYMDTHQGTDLPAELRRHVEGRIKNGEKDEHGVVDRGLVIDREAGTMHCILDAPSVDAVRKHHEGLNVPIEMASIHRADAILR